MTEVSRTQQPGPTGGGDPPVHLHLLMAPGENRRLLVDWLSTEYRLTDGTAEDPLPEEFDLCIVDRESFLRYRGTLTNRKRRVDPECLPVLLITTESDRLRSDASVWDIIDDLVETPVGQAELAARIENLAERRRTSRRLVDRELELSETISDLQRKELAMDAAPVGVTITDPRRPDNPTIYANTAVERITGYPKEAILGRNMRFLQGPETDQATVDELREAVESGEQAAVTLINYRRGGGRFWNRVEVAPVHHDSGDLVAYVGFQTDVTDRRIREQRLSVLNRVMRHNLANDLNLIEGHTDNLLDSVETDDQLEALQRIKQAAEKLERLGRTANWTEQVINSCRDADVTINVGRTVRRVGRGIDHDFQEAEIDVEVEEGPWFLEGCCLREAVRELLENAVKHNNGEQPNVSVTVGPAMGEPDHVELQIADNGPGIPERVIDVLRMGRETQLNHGDGLGLWLVYWVVTLLGGAIEVDSKPAGDGTVITLTLPATTGQNL